MLTEKLHQLDANLRRHHADVYETLYEGIDPHLREGDPCQAWFQWKNGQQSFICPLFIGRYRFVPFAEAQSQPRTMRRSIWRDPMGAIATLLFARRSLFSWPLLVDAAFDGYYFSRVSRRVFHKFKGERDRFFGSFELFVDLLIQLSDSPAQSSDQMAAREVDLLMRYSV